MTSYKLNTEHIIIEKAEKLAVTCIELVWSTPKTAYDDDDDDDGGCGGGLHTSHIISRFIIYLFGNLTYICSTNFQTVFSVILLNKHIICYVCCHIFICSLNFMYCVCCILYSYIFIYIYIIFYSLSSINIFV